MDDLAKSCAAKKAGLNGRKLYQKFLPVRQAGNIKYQKDPYL